MYQSASGGKSVVVITDRGNREPLRSLMLQIGRLGYHSHLINRLGYEQTRHVAVPQVVLVDAAYQAYRGAAEMTANVRAVWEYIPIVLLIGANEFERMPYEVDAHGFLTLPIIIQELDARLRFAQWKTQAAQPTRDVLAIDALFMNFETYEVTVNDQPVELTFKEFTLLKYLASHPRRIFTRPELLSTVWDNDYDGGTRTVDVHIRRLRAKLGPHVGNMINTVRNVGYRFG